MTDQPSTFGAEKLALALIDSHTQERDWVGVEEDFRWLGRILEDKEQADVVPIRDDMEAWLRRQTPSFIWTGEDPGNRDVQFLITAWPDGSATIAYRDASVRTWGPPFALDAQPVE
jgi:hypothetical protein